MSFLEIASKFSWQEIRNQIYGISIREVEAVLNKTNNLTLEDFKALVSPAASQYLESMAKKSLLLTNRRFGKNIQLFIPLYLSNKCSNICTYCGFSANNKITRTTLTELEVLKEARWIKTQGFEHILLLSGESKTMVDVDYFKKIIKLLRPIFSYISLEAQPLEQYEYKELIAVGLDAVLVYQETYNKNTYAQYHLSGKKKDYEYRLNTLERLGNAGIQKMGLGALLGLDDWRVESFYLAAHLKYLEKKFWKTEYSISFPRLRPHIGNAQCTSYILDRELAQLICAFRIFNHEVDLSLSTRESEYFRDNIIKLGITSLSAGSKTNPGGYTLENNSLNQFEIADKRTPAQIESMLYKNGYQPVWQNWHPKKINHKKHAFGKRTESIQTSSQTS